ncbi:MAG: hypothetical protein ACI32Q_11360 [Intestinibaculum porci]|uniref:hypothetical protein n=1 Tax=Intestinibaculum porci TaxID=2487118 RepID=UPI003F0C23E1
MRKKIYYKAVFDYGSHKESLTYEELGDYSFENNFHVVRFTTKDGAMRLQYNEEEVILHHDASHLLFSVAQEIDNDYSSAHGMIPLRTKVEKLSGDDQTLKFIYCLYQGEMLVSHVYIMMRMSDLSEDA